MGVLRGAADEAAAGALQVLSTALFDKPAFKHLVCNGLVLAADGKKMSKRLKNYPDPTLVRPRPRTHPPLHTASLPPLCCLGPPGGHLTHASVRRGRSLPGVKPRAAKERG